MAQQYLNKKQELFCKFLAGGSTQIEAYELAGYEPSSANASTMANKPLIKERIKQLEAEQERRDNEFKILAMQAESADPAMAAAVAKGAAWSFQRIMDMMADNVRLAQVAGEYRAANECLKMMGEGMKMFDKATTPDDGKQGNTPTGLTYIKNLTQVLDREEEYAPLNPLAPRAKE